MNQRLTSAAVKKLPPPAAGERIHYDDLVSGFGARITSRGVRSFVLNYRTRAGRERRFTIGRFPDWSVVGARDEAKRLRRLIDAGGDPLADIETSRDAPTMAELIDRYESEQLPRRRASTQIDYRSIIAKYLRPAFKHLKVADISFVDIDRLHRRISKAGHKRRANTVVAVLSKILSLAIKWKMRTDNPAKYIERNSEHHRRRYLRDDELARLVVALAAHPDQTVANVIRILLLTGARRGEVLAMRWDDIDLGAGVWSKPASSTKQDEPHQVPLSAPARQLLSGLQRSDSAEYVFAGAGRSGHVVELKRAWRRICRAAGITGLRVHDLRHSFASQLASGGASLPLIGALLGHATPATTARYAHLHHDPMRAAAEKVGAAITAAGKRREG